MATEQEELQILKQNSPYSLPDNAAESGLTTAQIKEKFYSGLFYLYELFKTLRLDYTSQKTEVLTQMAVIQQEYEAILSGEFTSIRAMYDDEGNTIKTTYAKVNALTNGTLGVLNYLKANGQSEAINAIEPRVNTAIANILAYFNSDGKALQSVLADKAIYDNNGRRIDTYYATVTQKDAVLAEVTKILNGTSIVSKAYSDKDGNNIDLTYVKHSQVANNLNSTDTNNPLSAYQGKVLKELIDNINTLLQSDDTSLDQLQEIVNYVKNNKSLIDGITSSKVNVSDIVDNLTSALSGVPLSANQGYILKTLIDTLTNNVYTKNEVYTKEEADDEFRTENQVNTQIDTKLANVSNMNVIADLEESKNYTHQLLVNADGELILRLTEVN